MNHTLTSPFNSQSNGGPERTIHSLKQVLKKREIRRTDDMMLEEICSKVNQYQQGEQGPAVERFPKRKPRSLLPGSIERIINHTELVKARQE